MDKLFLNTPLVLNPPIRNDFDTFPLTRETIDEATALISHGEGVEIDCSTQFIGPAPLFGPLAWLRDASQEVIAIELTRLGAKAYYTGILNEHFSFDLIKNPRYAEVVVENIEIEVTDFQPLPVFVTQGDAAGDALVNNSAVLIIMTPKKCEELPWVYLPKWLLSDPVSHRVFRWGQERRVVLRDQFAERFMVKMFSTEPGIYTYDAYVVVRPPLGKDSRLQINDGPQTIAFTDVDVVREVDDNLLQRYGITRQEFNDGSYTLLEQ